MPVSAQSIVILYAFIVGAVVGSFLNVVIHRVPRRLSIVRPGSACPACSKPIAWYDNLPILSWIVLRGKCRSCRAPISFRYPLVEAAGAALGAFGVATVSYTHLRAHETYITISFAVVCL